VKEMSETITILLNPDIKNKLNEIAKECDLPLEKACELILSEFARVIGGRIYTGRWRETNGLMCVIQWPFLAGFVKISGEELIKFKEMKQ
jgi:hypothetical protein